MSKLLQGASTSELNSTFNKAITEKMVVAKCPLSDCPFVTPELDEDSACRFLAYHGNEHFPNMFLLIHETPHFPQQKYKNHKPKNIVKRGKVPTQQTKCGHRNNDKAGSIRKNTAVSEIPHLQPVTNDPIALLSPVQHHSLHPREIINKAPEITQPITVVSWAESISLALASLSDNHQNIPNATPTCNQQTEVSKTTVSNTAADSVVASLSDRQR